MSKPLWDEWLMDVTMWPRYCFCPYERDTETIVLGLNMVSDRSPGPLVGIFHDGGQEAVEEWERGNPDWHERYSPRAPEARVLIRQRWGEDADQALNNRGGAERRGAPEGRVTGSSGAVGDVDHSEGKS